MGALYVGYTLADIVGLASSNTFTYLECTEILEEELMKRFLGSILLFFIRKSERKQ